jgi:hypothetical protein
MEYILSGANGKVVCILLLQPDGTICFKHLSSQVDFKATISLIKRQENNLQRLVSLWTVGYNFWCDSSRHLLSNCPHLLNAAQT